MTLNVGGTQALLAAIAPTNADIQAIEWKSDDISVATVNTNGLVTAAAPGTCTITATAQDGSDIVGTCAVTVNALVNAHPPKITIQPRDEAVTVNGSVALSVTAGVSDGGTLSYQWYSNNTNSYSGGSAIPGAKTASIASSAAKVTVTDAPGGIVYRFTQHFGTYTGQEEGLPGVVDANIAAFTGLEVDGKTLHGSNYSTNAGSTIINLHPSYLNTLANGTYAVRAVFMDGYAEGSFTVNRQAVSVTGVTLDKSKITLAVGGNATLTATVSPSNSTNKGVTWSSSDTSIATVNNSGKVTGVKAGAATITVTTEDGGYTATCKVTVTDATGLPQTGDSNNMMLWLVTLLASILGILCVLVWRKWQDMKDV